MGKGKMRGVQEGFGSGALGVGVIDAMMGRS